MHSETTSSFTIEIAQVTKCHLIFNRPGDRLKQIVIPRFQRLVGTTLSSFYTEFWALRGISLKISKGQTLGIIGRNGAGKSTLLQIICGTLAPTAGTISIRGRVAALLELGSGFNPEFTGRENVYLNASLLGLKKREIDERFGAIAEFAGIGPFIDQPVKTYSSGMFVRLAFAVIAHVDADILIIDEALAVGDAVFTQKCMRFLRRFKERGTLIFVSHDISAIMNLCDRALWLDRGAVRMEGEAKQVAEAYFQDSLQEISRSEIPQSRRPTVETTSVERAGSPFTERVSASHIPDHERPVITLFKNLSESPGLHAGGATIRDVRLIPIDERNSGAYRGGDPVALEIEAFVAQDLASPIIGFLVKDRLGQALFGDNTYGYGPLVAAARGSTLSARFEFSLPLMPSGSYSIAVAIADGSPTQNVQHHWLHDAVIMNVTTQRLWLGLMGIPMKAVYLSKT